MISEQEANNYLIFSDVHLGADLVQHVRPWTLSSLKQVARIDRDLASMLDFYRAHRDPIRPWKLVIAGDLVDFIGMSIAPASTVLPMDAERDDDLTDEERLLGLGSTRQHAGIKMRAVARRHPLVFEKLAAFVAEGHSLIVVRGNHDIDFYWDTAQEAFVEALVERVDGLDRDPDLLERFRSRVSFHDWFYYEKGLLYVEHGHQFDAMCSYHHALAPVSPEDNGRICWSFSDILLRVVVRPTPGLSTEGHESWRMMDYIRLACSLGILGAFRLGYRYLSAVRRAVHRWRSHLSDRARHVKAEHERRMEELSRRMQVGVDKLRALSALWPAPITRGLVRVLRSVHLDRILLGGTIGLSVAALVLMLPVAWWVPIGVTLVGAAGAYIAWSNRRRLADLDPTQAMRKGARRIAKLLDVRFIVMGHTHLPLAERISDESTYVNLGNWGADDLHPRPDSDPPRTHLVLRWIDGQLRPEFCRWDRELGPLPQPFPTSVARVTGHG